MPEKVKKDPYQFTIHFNKNLTGHRQAAAFLNKCGRTAKAHVIAEAINLYLVEQKKLLGQKNEVFPDMSKSQNESPLMELLELPDVAREYSNSPKPAIPTQDNRGDMAENSERHTPEKTYGMDKGLGEEEKAYDEDKELDEEDLNAILASLHAWDNMRD